MSRAKPGNNTRVSTYMHYPHETFMCEKCDGYGWVEGYKGRHDTCDGEKGCGGLGVKGHPGVKVVNECGSEHTLKARERRARKAEIGEEAFKVESKAKHRARLSAHYARLKRKGPTNG